MATLEENLAELESVKQAFKTKFTSKSISTTDVEYRNYPNLLNGMEKTLPNQTKTVNPTTTSQQITADTGYKLQQVNVNAIQTEEKTVKSTETEQTINPTSGKFINKVTVEPIILQNKTINPTTNQQNINADENYDGLNQVTINAIQTEEKTVKSTETEQTINSTSGKFINKITVSPILAETKNNVNPTTSAQKIEPTTGYDYLKEVNILAVTNTIDSNIQASNIKKDIEILGVTGTLESGGSTINNQDKTITENGIYTADEGYTGLGTVTVDVEGEGTDVSDTTAIADDVLAGKDFYLSSGIKTSGTIQTFTPDEEYTENGTLQTKGKFVDENILINVEGGGGGDITDLDIIMAEDLKDNILGSGRIQPTTAEYEQIITAGYAILDYVFRGVV